MFYYVKPKKKKIKIKNNNFILQNLLQSNIKNKKK